MMSRQRWILLEYPSFHGGATAVADPTAERSCPIWVPDAELLNACVYCGRPSVDHDSPAPATQAES
jgi:hypothetical protein